MGNIKVQRKKESSTKSGLKRQEKVTRISKSEPADKKKKPNEGEKRKSQKGQNFTFYGYLQ